MQKQIPHSAAQGQAKGIVGQATDARQLSPSLESEVHASLARSLRLHKAETIAAECGVDRATIYKWAAKPGRVPLAKLTALAAFDPDPEFLPRVGGLLLAVHAQRALANKAQGESVAIFHQVNGRWIR